MSRQSRRESYKHLSRFVQRYWLHSCVGILIVWLSVIPLKLAITSHQVPQPQGIFVLGGHPDREKAAATVAKHYPNLEIWISSGSQPDVIRNIFQDAGVTSNRIHLDYSASDTVTNFTTLVSEFERQRLRHLWLITSDFHMARSQALASLILGSHWITYTPHAVPSNDRPPESILRMGRDIIRAVVWLVTGQTGEVLSEKLSLESDQHSEVSVLAPEKLAVAQNNPGSF